MASNSRSTPGPGELEALVSSILKSNLGMGAAKVQSAVESAHPDWAISEK